jgi:hypothetical protein
VFKSTISKYSDIENHDTFLCFIEGIYNSNKIDTYNTAKQISYKTCSHFCLAEDYETILPTL